MRIAIPIILVLASAALFFLAATWRSDAEYPVWNHSIIPYQIPTVPEEHNRKITYLSKTPGKQYETDDGPTEYLRHHQFGWNDCLYYFYRDWPFHDDQPAWSATEDEYGQAPWIHGAPSHINDARRDGWLTCADEIRALLRTNSETELRGQIILSQFPIIASITGLGTILLGFASFTLLRRYTNKNGT